MKLQQAQQVFTQNVGKLIAFAQEKGIGLTFGEAYRTQSQVLLNYHGRRVVESGGELILIPRRPTSKTKRSNHPRRLAVDFNFFIEQRLTYSKPELQELGDYWESLDPANRWGGNWTSFVDTPHFEMRY